MEEVGFTAKRTTTAWPVEMPPRMPPALLERNTGLPPLPMRISSEFSSPGSAAAPMPAPISTPLAAWAPVRAPARRLPAAAAITAQPVFHVVGVVGVAGAVFVLDVGIVLRARVDIVDHEPDRRSGRHLRADQLVGKNAREDAHLVRLLPLSREARLSRPALVEIRLDVGLAERNTRRRPVDHAADRDPVAFAKGRDPKQVAEGVERHGNPLGFRCRSPQRPTRSNGLGQALNCIALIAGPRTRKPRPG